MLCSTPIGNLRDITLRALDELRAADIILSEDTRRTAVLLNHHGIRSTLLSYHEHNEAERLRDVRRLLVQGSHLVAVSDAGTPSVADPGYRLLHAALEAGAEVTALPGPSAFLPALVLSGLPMHAFAFYGFLPRTFAQRDAMVREALSRPMTGVWYESPRRLPGSLSRMCALGYGHRHAVVARELTKLHEEVIRGTVAELAARVSVDAPRGEIVLCIGPETGIGHPPESGMLIAVDEVMHLCAEGTALSRAVAEVAATLGMPKRPLYVAALARRRSE